jgi:hypothetical protein
MPTASASPIVEPFPGSDPAAPTWRGVVGTVTCCQAGPGHLLPEEAAHHLADTIRRLALANARLLPGKDTPP